MAYDEQLAQRTRALLAAEPEVTEQRMFGGLAFLVAGNMAVGVRGQGGLMVRVEPGETPEPLAEPHTRPFEMRGRAVRGWLRVDAQGVATDADLRRWVERGLSYARSLPPEG